jgi:hypothetical protein
MDAAWFDRSVTSVGGNPSSRQSTLRWLGGGGVLGRLLTGKAAARCAKVDRRCETSASCCGAARCRRRRCSCPSGRVVCSGRCCGADEVCDDPELQRGCRPVTCPAQLNPDHEEVDCGPSGSGCGCFVGLDGSGVCADTVVDFACSSNSECEAEVGAGSVCLNDAHCFGAATCCSVPCSA